MKGGSQNALLLLHKISLAGGRDELWTYLPTRIGMMWHTLLRAPSQPALGKPPWILTAVTPPSLHSLQGLLELLRSGVYHSHSKATISLSLILTGRLGPALSQQHQKHMGMGPERDTRCLGREGTTTLHYLGRHQQ